MAEDNQIEPVVIQPQVAMSAVKLDKDGNVVEEIEFDNVQASPGFLEMLKQAAKQGWEEGKHPERKDS